MQKQKRLMLMGLSLSAEILANLLVLFFVKFGAWTHFNQMKGNLVHLDFIGFDFKCS